MKKIIAVILMGILLNLPVIVASEYSVQGFIDETYDNFNSRYTNYLSGRGKAIDLGEAIIINVRGYQPEIIPQSSIENQQVPVYVYLSGTTFGTLATYITGESQEDITTGISNIPPIKEIIIKPDEASKKYLATYPKYIKPVKDRYSLDNLGQLILVLNQEKDETKVPTKIDLNFSAEIYFDLEKGSLFDISQQNLILNTYPEEKPWLDLPDYLKGGVFANRAFIRAVKVSGERAQFMVYDKDYHILPAAIGY